MPSVFDSISQLGPAGLVVEALVATASAIGLLLAFILLRRAIRSRYFRRLNRRTLEIRHNWEKIIGGVILPETWFNDRLTRNIVECMLLDRLEVASAEEIEPLHQCLRFSGLLDARIHEARLWRGWRRRQALLSLGRMRVPEGISALAEALDDPSEEIRVAGIRGLGRVELPKAAEPILEHLTQGQFNVPTSVVQSALLGCFRTQPSLMLPHVHQADDRVRPLLARVLSEVATPGLDGDLLLLTSDPIAEVRASAARALAEAKPPFTLSALTGLAADEEWFVRLRAVIAIGRLHEPRAIPVLLQTLLEAGVDDEARDQARVERSDVTDCVPHRFWAGRGDELLVNGGHDVLSCRRSRAASPGGSCVGGCLAWWGKPNSCGPHAAPFRLANTRSSGTSAGWH